MTDKKMYSMNQMVSLPENILLSDAMYKINTSFTIPQNIKETYYQNKSPESKNKILTSNEDMDNLKARQENILKKLNEIKEKLNNFKGTPIIHSSISPQVSSADFNSLGKEQDEESVKIINKIENFKNLLQNAQNCQDDQNEKEMEEWKHIILEQLIVLKGELDLISERNRQQISFRDEGEDLKQRQNCIVEIILALQTLLNAEISPLQDDLQDNPSNISVEGFHSEVLALIAGLQKEFERVSKALMNLEIKVEKQVHSCVEKRVLPNVEKDLKCGLQSFPLPQNVENKKGTVINDIVVCANASSPPYFLLLVKKILQPSLRILLSSSIHSSSTEVDPAVLKLFQDNGLKERSSYDVAFTVIWKNQPAKSLMVKPFSQSTIVGEGNILRYLARVFSVFPSLSYETQGSVLQVSESDYWIDLIQAKLLHASNKERQSVLKQLNSKLGTSEWISGSSLGVCDIFLWSVILQLEMSSGLPSNVAKWFARLNHFSELNLGEIKRN